MAMVRRSEKGKMLSHGFSVGVEKIYKAKGWSLSLVLVVTGWMGTVASFWSREKAVEEKNGGSQEYFRQIISKMPIKYLGILRYIL